VKLAEAVVAACAQPSQFRFLYDLDQPIVDKIETIVREVCAPSVRARVYGTEKLKQQL
jgi:formyltetrahydrofolate synthetase